MVTTTTTATSSSSIPSSSTSNGGLSNDRNASAASAGRGRGLSATTTSVWANIVKGEPNAAAAAAAPPTSSPKNAAAAASSSSVSQVNQKIDPCATASVAAADSTNTTDVKSSSASSCNHNDNNINCTSDGEKEPSGSPASDFVVATTTSTAATASVKKPAAVAWKRPSYNGTTTANAEAGLVIGDAFSWPALSESAANNVRGSTKSPSPSPTPSYLPSPSDSSLKPLSLSQVSHVATSSSQTQKQSTNHEHHNPTSNHASTNRQRSTKRGTNTTSNSNSSGAGALMNGVLASQSQSSSAGVSVEKPQRNSSGTPPSTVPDSSVKDSSHKMNNFERGSKGRGGFASQPDQSAHQHNSSFRRGSGGPHPRGDGNGPYRQNHTGRREHDHRDWNSHYRFNGRDAQQHQQMHPRMMSPRNNYIRPPPGSVTGAFIAPPQPVPLRPFGNAMGYPDMPSPVYFVPDPLRGVPFLPAAPFPMFFPGTDPNLYSTIAKQIEYYFSSVNLCKDIFLRQKMDEQGWVPISLIAGFRRVEQLMKRIPNNIQFILDAVRASTIVETNGDRIRKRNDWMNWILPPTAINFAPIPVPQSVGVPEDVNSANPDMNNHLQSSDGEGTSEGTL